jgi:esterase/lipase
MFLLIQVGAGNSTRMNVYFEGLNAQLTKKLSSSKSLNIKIVQIEMPGHDSTELAPEMFNIDTWSKEVYKQIQYHVIKNKVTAVFVMGVSLGGHIVYRVMAEHMNAQSSFALYPIVQGSPPKGASDTIPQYKPTNPITQEAINFLAAPTMTYEEAAKFVWCQFSKGFLEKQSAEFCKRLFEIARSTHSRDKFVGSLFRSSLDEFEVVERYPKRILMMHATNDSAVNPEYLELIGKNRLFLEKINVCNGGHQLAVENPVVVAYWIKFYMENV